MVDEGKMRVDKFNGQKFQLWKMQIDDQLYQKDLWKPLEGNIKNQGSMKNDDWDLFDRKVLGRIQSCLVPLVAFDITKEKTIEQFMQTIEKLYENPFASNKVFLMKHLFNMNMEEGGVRINLRQK